MKSLAVFSAKGSVGKSAIAVNLVYQAATLGGRRTLLWDMDAQGAATWLLKRAPAKVLVRAALTGGTGGRDGISAVAHASRRLEPAAAGGRSCPV